MSYRERVFDRDFSNLKGIPGQSLAAFREWLLSLLPKQQSLFSFCNHSSWIPLKLGSFSLCPKFSRIRPLAPNEVNGMAAVKWNYRNQLWDSLLRRLLGKLLLCFKIMYWHRPTTRQGLLSCLHWSRQERQSHSVYIIIWRGEFSLFRMAFHRHNANKEFGRSNLLFIWNTFRCEGFSSALLQIIGDIRQDG